MPIASAFRSALLVFALALSFVVSPALLAQGSTAADGFNPNVDGNVNALALQPDGKVIIAGNFTQIQPNGADQPTAHLNIARVLPDGRNDSSFNSSVNGQINAMVLQADGKIVIGGKFTDVGGTPRLRIARLNADGSLDTTFTTSIQPTNSPTTSLTPEVMALALQADGKIVVGGGFTGVQGTGASEAVTRNRVLRLNTDGSVDAGFNPNANGMVLSLAVDDSGRVLIGGGFTTIGGGTTPVTRNRIARVSPAGAVDGFDPSANNAVSAIEVLPNGNIVIGGTFTTLKPNGASDAVTIGVVRIAQLDPNGALTTKTDSDNKLVPDFSGSIDGQVSVIKRQQDGRLLIGGLFTTVSGSSRSFLARLTTTGAIDATFGPTPNYAVNAILVQPNGSIILGGGFSTFRGTGINSIVRNHVARIAPSGSLDNDFRPDVNGRLRALMVQSDGKIIAGGSFTSVAGTSRSGLVRLNANGSVDPSFNASVNGGVTTALQQPDGKIVIAGAFTRVNGGIRSYIARLFPDGSLDEAYSPAPNGQVNAMLRQASGKLIIGGSFTSLSPAGTTEPVSRNYIARLNDDGTLDDSFKAQASDAIWALAAQSDGKVVVGGAFSVFLGTSDKTTSSRNSVARIDVDGNLDSVFNPNVNGTVFAVGVQSDGKIVIGGNFLQLAPNGASTVTDRNRIARLNADGTLDTAFTTSINDVVIALAVQSDGKILVAGGFNAVQGTGASSAVSRLYVARLTSTGSLDDGYNLYLDVTPGNQVVALALTSSGKALIGGAFSQIGLNPRVDRTRIAQINTDGTPDTTFNADLGAGGAPISAITLQYDGQILAAGTFATMNGTGSANLARFYGDGMPDVTFVPSINGSVYTIAEGPIKGTATTTQNGGFAWLENNGRLRTSFVVGSTVTSMTSLTAAAVQPDKKVLIAGTFQIVPSTGAAAVATSLVRFNPDGSVDPNFALKATGSINVIKVLSDGKIMIGGTFSTIDGTARNNIARLNADGTLDTNFSVAADGAVYTIGFQSDGKIVLGGNFTSVAPNGSTTYTSRNYLARLNTDLSIDTGFDPKANAAVQALVIQADGKIVVGGNFTTLLPNGATTTTPRSYIARLNTDGTVDTAVDLKSNGQIAALALQADNKIVAGGYFTSIGAQARHYVARFNADLTVDSFNPNPNSSVFTVSVQPDQKILIGGAFTALQPGSTNYDPAQATPRNRAARLNADGTIDATFNPNFNAVVGVLVSYPDSDTSSSVIATGSFSTIQPTGALFVGGSFSLINNIAVNNLALIGADGSVSSTFLPNPNGTVYAAVQLADGRSVVGGAFTSIAGATRNRIARFSDTNNLDTSFNPDADGDVYAIALQADGKMVVGGSFTKMGGSARPNLVRLNTDGTVDGTFNPSVSGAVRSVVIQPDGRVLITEVTGTGTNRLKRLDANGNADGSFNASNDGEVNSIAVQADGKITVGGSFSSIGGGSRKRLARLNANGTLDASITSEPNGTITALALQPDGKIVIGGLFSSVDGLPRAGLARVSTSASASESFSINAGRNTIIWNRAGAAPEISGVIFETSPDAITWTQVGAGSRISGSSNWQITGLTVAAATTYVRTSGIMPASPNSSSGLIESRGYLLPTGTASAPVISSATVVSTASGSGFLYAISASGNPTGFSATGLPPGLSFNATTGVISGTPTVEGTYTIVLTATNAYGSSTVNLTLYVNAPGSTTNLGRLINLSVNAQINSSNTTVIAGFVITGSGSQNVLLRAVGPGLESVGATGVLARPSLKLYKGQEVVNSNSAWGGGSELVNEFARLGAFPLAANSADAALLVTLAPGPYTIHVSDLGTAGGTVLAEIYDALPNPPPANSPHLVNISARGVVTSSQLVTGGFVIAGTTSRKVLIRGIGPGLTAQNVSGALADPAVTLHQITGGVATVIARNDNWGTPVTVSATYPPATGAEISAAGASAGAFALTAASADSAILVTLAPGVYTAQVSGVGSASGAAMVEIYEIQ